MAELKTKLNDASVKDFIDNVENDQTRHDCYRIVEMMQKATEAPPKMWGTSIVGFGTYHYRYASGREADWLQVGFSPRKQALSIYLMGDFEERQELLQQLGKHTTGKGCLYIKRLSDVDEDVLFKLINASVHYTSQVYPTTIVN